MKGLAAGLLLFYVAFATAAGRVPTAVEFRAAYCARIMQWSVRQLSSDQNTLEQRLRARRQGGASPAQHAGLSDETLQEMLQRTKKKAADEHAVLEELRKYLELRISGLEPQALRAAQQRADADIQDVADLNSKCGFQCTHGPDFEACLAKKCGGEDVLRRFSGCRDSDWLVR
jgi:hypothetical protein